MITEVVRLLEGLLEALRAPDPVPSAPPSPDYLSVADFAKRLAVTPRAVRAMIADGMPHRRPRPRLIRIPVALAEAWIEARTKPQGAAETAARERAILDVHRGEFH